MTPERELWRYVLMQAVFDLVGYRVAGACRPLIENDARNWILSDRCAVGSFV